MPKTTTSRLAMTMKLANSLPNNPGCLLRRTSLVVTLLVCSLATACPPVHAQIHSARDLIPGLSEDQWHQWSADPLSDEHHYLLRKIVLRMDNWSRSMRQNAQTGHAGIPPVDNESMPGDFIQISGAALSVSGLELKSAPNFDGELISLHVVRLQRPSGGSASVVTPRVPSRLLDDPRFLEEQPVAAHGILISESAHPVLVAPEVAWYPATAGAFVKTGEVILAEHGVDIGQLDRIQNGSLKTFTASERILFKQLLVAMRRLDADPAGLPRAEPFDLIAALKNPSDQKGQWCRVEGTVRRISRVQIPKTGSFEPAGPDHFYHVDLSVPLEDQRLVLGKGDQPIVFSNEYGITLVLFDLPPFLDEVKGANRNPKLRMNVPGFYLKTWRHQTIETREHSRNLRRPNPVVFGVATLAEPVELTDPRGPAGAFAILIGWFWVALAMILGGLAIWQWRSYRRARSEWRPPDSVTSGDMGDA